MKETHALHRTSPKGEGQKFVGTCSKCGKEGLTFDNMSEDCENTNNMSQDEALLKAIKG